MAPYEGLRKTPSLRPLFRSLQQHDGNVINSSPRKVPEGSRKAVPEGVAVYVAKDVAKDIENRKKASMRASSECALFRQIRTFSRSI